MCQLVTHKNISKDKDMITLHVHDFEIEAKHRKYKVIINCSGHETLVLISLYALDPC